MSDSYYEHLFGVRDKVVLITGGTRGIGLMIAEGMVRCGANVYIASRKEDACRAAEDDLGQHGKCTAIPSDISSIDGCQTLADEIATREGRLDVLINNAGVTWSEDIDKFSEKAWDKVVDLDAKSPFFLTQRLLPQLRIAASPESRAVVINVSSVNGIRPSSLRNYSYVVAKAGLQQLSVQLAQDLNADNINVNCILPGLIATDELKGFGIIPPSEDKDGNPIPRLELTPNPEDVADLALFLASPASDALTGEQYPIRAWLKSERFWQ